MFSYFESSVDGIIPNDYSSLEDIFSEIFGCIASVRDSCMLTARRCWLAKQQLVTPEFSKKIFQFSFSKDSSDSTNTNVSTSTTVTTTSTPIAQDFDASINNGQPMNEVSTKLTKSTDPAKQMPSANVNNSQILLNNFNNLNKRYKNSETKLILTNNENHDDGYYNEFSNANDTKPQKQFTKKQN